MIKQKLSKQIRIVFAIFIISLFTNKINAQGPNAPEAASFEPVDATDMVNLVTGDLSYVLPLLNVPSPEGGYPIALSYHAGIAMEQEASWVGLGWNVNPGAINRSVNGDPDDWRNGKQFNFVYSDLGEEEEITIGIGATFKIFNVAIDYSFINGKASGGTIEFGIGFKNSSGFSGLNSYKAGVSVGYGGKSGVSFNTTVNNVSVGMSSNGNISLGAQKGFLQNTLSFNQKSGLSFSQQGNALGISLRSGGIGYSLGRYGFNSIVSNHITAGGVSVNRKGFISAIPISKIFHVKFSYFKTTAHIFDSENNSIYGALYSKEGTYSYSNSIEAVERRHMDVLGSFMSGNHSPTNVSYSANFETLNYDDYDVSGQGISEKIQPYVYEYGYLTGKSPSQGKYIYFDNPFSKEFGDESNNIYFYSTVSNNSFLKIDNSTWNIPQSIANITDVTSNEILNYNFNNQLGYNSSSKRKRSGTLVESYTNLQIKSNPSLIYEATNFTRYTINGDGSIDFHYPNRGIGAFKVTTEDGKTYHYSLPVYQYENMTKGYDNIRGKEKSFSEIQRVTPYATHWLLTAITGPDYLDNNSDGKINDDDYGYWVTFDYGKWTDSFMWYREVKDGKRQRGRIDVLADEKENIVESWGIRQLYYLNAINTRTHSALFLKSVRNDNMGTHLSKSWTYNDVNKGIVQDYANLATGLYFQDNKYTYDANISSSSSLKLDKILIIKHKDLDKFNLVHSQTPNINQTSNSIDLNVSGDRYNVIGQYLGETNKTLHQRTWLSGNYEDNVYLSNKFNQTYINEYALSSTDFEYSYDLAKETSSSNGKLTLEKVLSNGKNNISLIPPYEFLYYNNGATYDEDNFDLWGYYKSYPENWSLKQIKSPTGNELMIKYERDDFKTVLLNGNGESNYDMTPKPKTFLRLNNGYSGSLELIHTNPCYEIGEIYSCITINNSIDIEFNESDYNGSTSTVIGATITGVYNDYITVDFDTQVPSNFSGDFYADHFNGWSNIYNVTLDVEDCFSEQAIGKCNDSRGGLRVSEIVNIYDNNSNSTFYEYTNPTTGESSGMTAQTPYVNFSSLKNLIPGSGVMYEYVTVLTKDENDNHINKEVYNFHSLSPLNYSIGLTYGRLSSSENVIDQIDNYLKIEYDEQIVNTNIVNSTSDEDEIKLMDLKVYNNYSLLGTLKSRKEYNSKNQIINSLQYDYGDTPFANKLGTSAESFKSYSVYESDGGTRGNSISYYDLTKTSFIKNPSIVKSTTTTQGGFTTTTTFNKHDFLTGQVLETTTTDSKGNEFKTELIPAYTIAEYSDELSGYGMGSKVDNPTNYNMLTQEAMTKTYLKVGNEWKETGVGITTWNNQWDYTEFDGNKTLNSTIPNEEKIWRKHKSFVWDGGLNPDGTLQGFTNPNPEQDDESFDWTVNPTLEQPNTDWKNVSTTTQYNHYSMPLEVRDINNNYASTKMCDDNTKVLAVSNAQYTEMYYSGAEYVTDNTSYFDGQVKSAGQNQTTAHTGTHSVTVSSGGKGFEVNMIDNQHRAGKYKVSVWVEKSNHAQARISINGNTKPFNGEEVYAGNWVLKTHYEDLSTAAETVYITSAGSTIYIDDFRLHPIASSMTSYVYNEWDELWYIISNNGLASKFEYDAAGRLITTETEVADFNGEGTGGFKTISKNSYNYKNNQ
ncbi:hypothetical protein [Neotamlana laminarinivorans]|uniref:YD repeat-containing protein n=1 Tax=Neotamlana laminarinivorans TaxID=2883124 RepID=A0A9X1HW22_9FLAO|nr:hypothetical protein [Tamlana laminarinivorans]MCB4797228.1 hypothetical protein [Tamlana laminarinivorans]